METEIYGDIARALAAGQPGVTPERIRIPARRDAAGVYAPTLPCPAPRDFPTLYGAALVSAVERRGDWLYVTLTDVFYDALAAHVVKILPKPVSDGGSLAVNRLLALARLPGSGCPPYPAVQRALLLAAGAETGTGAYRSAEWAALRMLPPLPKKEREAVRRRCGAVADAVARLLAAAGGEGE